ncbi:TIGR04222 domain-containing membrane protein [Actinomadura sp. B10D3]|uniref:TIGR04222 domain-containing membrane protein n=1 Tax=Actinomadura sp. B10D3 TaxID=3153557 RepID=UPI00325E379C
MRLAPGPRLPRRGLRHPHRRPLLHQLGLAHPRTRRIGQPERASRRLHGRRHAARRAPMEEIDPYETAYLCGGPRRVVETAIFVLYRQRRVRVSRGTHRIDAVMRESDDPVQEAVLREIPDVGRLLGQVISAAATSPEMRPIAQKLAEDGLLRRGLRRRTRKGVKARRRLTGQGADEPSPVLRVAMIGPAGIEEARMREILESDDPEPISLPRGAPGGRTRGRGLGLGAGGDAEGDSHGDGWGSGGDAGGGGAGGGGGD